MDCAGPNAVSNLANSFANMGFQDQHAVDASRPDLLAKGPHGVPGVMLDRSGFGQDLRRPNEMHAPMKNAPQRLGPQRPMMPQVSREHQKLFDSAFQVNHAPSASNLAGEFLRAAPQAPNRNLAAEFLTQQQHQHQHQQHVAASQHNVAAPSLQQAYVPPSSLGAADPFLAYPRLAPPPQSVFDDSFKVASGWDRAQFAHREAQNVMDQAFAEAAIPEVEEVIKPIEPILDTPGDQTLDKDAIAEIMKDPDPKWQNSKFLNFLRDLSEEKIKLTENDVIPNPDYVEKSEIKVADPLLDEPAASWAHEFARGDGEQKYADPFNSNAMVPLSADASAQWSSNFEENFKSFYAAAENEEMDLDAFRESMRSMGDAFGGFNFEDDGLKIEEDPEYKFEEQNPFVDENNPFERGLRLMKEGKLTDAILAFEAAVKLEPENSEAWKFLGQCCAENEDERGAIAALLKCISLDPYNLEALLMCGVSFTNELDSSRALEYLQNWLTHHPDYHALGEGAAIAPNGPSQQEQVTALFLRAHEAYPADSDINVVLGVLHNITGEYGKAADYFRSALQSSRADDASLWNKLGATLANGNKCGDAIEAYRRALSIRPNYVRALSNLGISFSNMSQYHEACQSYLAAVDMNPDATHVWDQLRSCLLKSKKVELTSAVDRRQIGVLKSAFSM